MDDVKPDIWSDWLLHRRIAGDRESDCTLRANVERYADRVLDGAQLAQGMTLLDVGAGEGLVAFRAIARTGPSLHVILADISAFMLHHARTCASEKGILGQCEFFEAAADRLECVEDDVVDVVTTRSVLAYVADKSAALREFYRVLKPGGRISIAEPIFRDEALSASAMKIILDARTPDSQERLMPLLHRWKAAQFPDTEKKIAQSPLTNYTERDLVYLAHKSGFAGIHLEFHIDVDCASETSWEIFLNKSPHPLAPPLAVILRDQFTVEEQKFFEKSLRPTVESGDFINTGRMAYLTARKPCPGA